MEGFGVLLGVGVEVEVGDDGGRDFGARDDEVLNTTLTRGILIDEGFKPLLNPPPLPSHGLISWLTCILVNRVVGLRTCLFPPI